MKFRVKMTETVDVDWYITVEADDAEDAMDLVTEELADQAAIQELDFGHGEATQGETRFVSDAVIECDPAS